MRRNLAAEVDLESNAVSLETLPLHLYNTVIQQLKQQKHELQLQSQAEQRRARTTENFSQAVLSNLSSGVLVFGLNGVAAGLSLLSKSAELIIQQVARRRPQAIETSPGKPRHRSQARRWLASPDAPGRSGAAVRGAGRAGSATPSIR